MKKFRLTAIVAAAALMLAACSSPQTTENTAQAAETTQAADADSTETVDDVAKESITNTNTFADEAGTETGISEDTSGTGVTVRVGSLKGPTSIGLLKLMEDAEDNLTSNDYEFTMAVQADELSAGIVGETLDIALLPANVASVLYNRTDGGVTVIDINTLGVLYMVTADQDIRSFDDLKGRTIYMTGKGTTPDYAFRYLLSANGISEDEVDLEFKSESTEVAALLAQEPGSIAVLPQPFVTSALMQNPDLEIVMDLTEEWDKVQGEGGSRLLTGVTIVRDDFLEEYPHAVYEFLNDHAGSTAFTAADPDATAQLIAAAGIIEKEEVAAAALPYCNIVCITGDDMKNALSGYFEVLYEQDPSSVGGALPGDDFYLDDPRQND